MGSSLPRYMYTMQHSHSPSFMAITTTIPPPPPSLFTTTTTTTTSNKKEDNTSQKKEANYGKIPFSNVVVRRRTRGYWGRKWNIRDVIYASVMLYMHVLSLFAPWYFTWDAFKLAVIIYIVVELFGITLSYHRQLAHQSFKTPKWLEYLFAYCGLHAMQGEPIDWVSRHRFHHKYTDKDQDPHSPIEGFWFSHINWILNTGYVIQKCGRRKNVQDLQKQKFYRFLQVTHLLHPMALGALLYKYGGLPYLVWGMGVRVVWCYHITFLVNSACHIWGYQSWNTGDLSKNNWFITLLVFGEGWHNNHHAFEYSARHGLEWWQLDITWYVIKILEFIGLATDLKLPTEAHKQKLSFKTETEDAKMMTEIEKQRVSFSINEAKTF